MARIVVGAYMVRYPLAGILTYSLQWLLALRDAGHDVYAVEKSGWTDSCFNPLTRRWSDDCSYGVSVVSTLLGEHGLADRWAFVDAKGKHHGLRPRQLAEVFREADVFLDTGVTGYWAEESSEARCRVLVDGDPVFTQLRMLRAAESRSATAEYDHYFTAGMNIGTPASSAPTAGVNWRHVTNMVVPALFEATALTRPPQDAPFTTVMSWQSLGTISHEGVTYGNKDLEFPKFVDLPARVRAPLELAAAGEIPRQELLHAGWRLSDPIEATTSLAAYRQYIAGSAGEFSVCKQAFVASNCGWFSDRAAAYLASGRPVVMQDTGFSQYLPTGRGLFAVRSVEEAASAIEEVTSDYANQSRWAAELARELLDAGHVVAQFLDEIGV